MDAITEIFGLIPSLKAGEMGAAGALITLLIRVYRLIPGAPWPSDKWQWLVHLVTFVLAFVASMLVGALAGGLGWAAAAVSAFGIAATAITGHEVTKALGKAVRAPEPDVYQPSPFRAAASLLVPAPKVKTGLKLEQ